jgi:GH15 family glucan-1,4-alpha-glucosidase
VSENTYRPIRDYGLIGDAHTAALVSSDGSIDWLCWPRFDSPAVFCRLLDKDKGGHFRVGPAERRAAASRAYVEGTNVLATVFSTDGGRFRLTDLMPVERLNQRHEGEDIASHYRVIRLVEGLSGDAEVEVTFRPTFDYARAEATFEPYDGGIVARGGREALALSCPAVFREDAPGGVAARFKVAAGQRVWVALTYLAGDDAASVSPPEFDADLELEQTLEYWREWSETCTYKGPYEQLVRRSALVLKLLTYEPTGALVAAPTTSLPEQLGGVRNWDYRFTWLRDSSLILYALQLLGYHEEATDFFEWLDRLCIPCGNELQIMYRIDGGSHLPERTLEHLEGYRGSRPVRVGNGAFDQKQLDIYGEVIDAAYLYHERMRRPVRPELWDTLRHLADQTVERWREPDHGIWEVRGGPRHFLYSKLLCWVALDRVVRMAAPDGLPGDVNLWERTREEIRAAILEEGYDEKAGAFTQAFGDEALDACALVIPQVGFLPATDPRVLSTVERIRERLTSHGLVYRYLSEDGLPGGEATFALCSFWLVDCLAEAGRADEARALFERIVGYANDLGLLAEEIDPVSGELLGNYPQGFTHLGLIRSALHIAKAEALGPEERAENQAERAGRIEKTGQVTGAPEGRTRRAR